jgi:TonB family protein
VTSSAAGSRAKLDLKINPNADGASAIARKAIDPELPSVDRIAHLIRARLGDAASADLDVCVAPSGRVTDVTLVRTSTLRAFDDAVLRDAETWQFTALPGPANVKSCSRATISYRAHR